jgi:hypothetical protein
MVAPQSELGKVPEDIPSAKLRGPEPHLALLDLFRDQSSIIITSR